MIRFRSTDIISLQDLVQRVLYSVLYLFWDIYSAVKLIKDQIILTDVWRQS